MKCGFLDLIGQRFSRLTVVEFHHKEQRFNSKGIKDGFKYYYKCVCDCGNECIVDRNSLRFHRTCSCGCLRSDLSVERKATHNKSKTKLYRVWNAIKNRCYNPNQKSYKDYGAKGIVICDDWSHDFQSFFDWAMQSGYKEGLTIERSDVNGNYEPSNCRWIPFVEQARNKTNNVLITYRGETRCLSEWARIVGIYRKTLKNRLDSGWSVEKAFNQPVKCR